MIKQPPEHWLDIAKQINSIAKTGLAYPKDKYDRKRYSELLDLSITILKNISNIDAKKLKFVFNRDNGYQTPKVGVRAVVVKNEKILLVKEKMDGKWTLPGGWADTGMTPAETAICEVKEEAGFKVTPKRILGLIDYNKHQEKIFPFDVYQLFMECKIVGGQAKAGIETSDVDFFSKTNLPELSERRVTKQQILTMFDLHKNKSCQPIFD